jgi:DNA-binding NtrC family response regulator
MSGRASLPNPTADPPAEQPGLGRAVLIIDDETTLARNLATYLERLGWATRVAGSAEDGLAQYGDFRPDVVLLDHNLPGRSGLEALGQLRGMDPQARVVLMTGYGGIDLAVSAMKQGAADYLTKPLALSELRLLLERLLAQQRLETAVNYYRGREAVGSGIDNIEGRSPAVVAMRERITALLDAERRLTDDRLPTVLIRGETGSGKELVARALHYGSGRASRPFVELNCGALPPQLLEAELFGYEKGAFTDARQRKIGLVETAEGGTLFLDEIAEADAATQIKLLKLLEDRSYRRLGGLREQRAHVRIVAATHRPLDRMVQQGHFRADLYFRLRMVEVQVPALRDREGDSLLLAQHFLRLHARRYARAEPVLTPEAQRLVRDHAWPGNVRELRNAMEQAVLLLRDDSVGPRELAFLTTETRPGDSQPAAAAAAAAADDDLNLERAERRLVLQALERAAGNITQAARLLGVSRDTLRYRLERLQLRASAGEPRDG